MNSKQLIALIGLLWITPLCIGGQIVTDGFVSQFVPRSPDAPEGDPRRLFNVYLPPTFFTDPTATFPIVYHLTGFGGNFQSFSETDKIVMDEMLAAGQVMPMIIVAPDPRVLTYGASFYVNSVLNGDFENYMVQELIPYVDARYRQRRAPSGDARFFRALMGQSMGGYGSLFYGIKYSDLFIAYAGDSPTSFWLITTAIAAPDGNPMYTFNKLLIPELTEDGEIDPQNGDLTFGFFAWAGAFSPNLSRPFKVDYPFVVDDTTNKPLIVPFGPDMTPSLVPVPSVLARWQSFDPFFLVDTANKEILKRQAIYFDAGADPRTEIIDNVGARYFSLKLSELNIKNEYVLYEGGHTSCTTSPEIECYRFRTNLQTFSAKFSENGLFADDIRTKITGTMNIILDGNSVMSINDKKLVGIETDPANGITKTDITITLRDSARLEIGNSSTIGGALQVGNPFGKANFIFDPSLLTHRVSFTLTIDGPQATAQIGAQGYLGFGVGIDGNRTSVPNYWGVSTLTNVESINLNFTQGNFIHNQIVSSITPQASLLALGESGRYSLAFDPSTFVIAGGGNLAKIIDTSLMHPTVLDTAGVIDQGGIRNREVIVPDPDNLFDEFYGPPKGIMGSKTFYTNKLQVNILASGQMLLDTKKEQIPANATLNQFFSYLEVEDYLSQGTKRAAFTIISGNPTVGFLPTSTKIEREVVSTADQCSPLNPTLNLQNLIKEGAVGIKLATIGGQRTILRLYDLDPP
ncbi:hypothetical protein H0X06_00275 [Candidatus Dependentiae bacterium]|nr:hypothetical protein [Candidatus Dependentiae bacterium]